MSTENNMYWLRINPDTFIWCKGEKGLLYDAEQKRTFEFANEGIIKRVCTELNVIDNLYCVDISEVDLKNAQFKSWVEEVELRKIGTIFIKQVDAIKPIALPPLLNIQQDVRRFVKNPSNYGGKDILKYLHEIIFYVNGGNINEYYYKQFIYPPYSLETLPENKIEAFINSLGAAKPGIIHVAGGNIFQYPELERLMNFIQGKEIHSCYYTTCSLITKGMIPYFFNQSSVTLKVLSCISNRINEEIINAKSALSDFHGNIEWVFIVESGDDCLRVDGLSELFGLTDVTVKSFFNGSNHGFFEQNVFLSLEERQYLELTKKNIFAHQVLNSINFGLLTVMPDSSVYANPNFMSIGTIDTPAVELVYNELIEGSSWRRIRDMEPCFSCVYQYLCPSPTNFEIVMGRQNLCNLY